MEAALGARDDEGDLSSLDSLDGHDLTQALKEMGYRPDELEGRVGNGESPEHFIHRLLWTQGKPCSWGSLHGMKGEEVYKRFFVDWIKRRAEDNNASLSVELGCGIGFNGTVAESFIPAIEREEGNIIIFTDYLSAHNPCGVPDNYVQVDLNNPHHVRFGGLLFDLVAASNVLTCEADLSGRYGVLWESSEIRDASLGAIVQLLKPNGLFYVDSYSRFPVCPDKFAAQHGLDVFHFNYAFLFQKKA